MDTFFAEADEREYLYLMVDWCRRCEFYADNSPLYKKNDPVLIFEAQISNSKVHFFLQVTNRLLLFGESGSEDQRGVNKDQGMCPKYWPSGHIQEIILQIGTRSN